MATLDEILKLDLMSLVSILKKSDVVTKRRIFSLD